MLPNAWYELLGSAYNANFIYSHKIKKIRIWETYLHIYGMNYFKIFQKICFILLDILIDTDFTKYRQYEEDILYF